jgi:hypothetical protein
MRTQPNFKHLAGIMGLVAVAGVAFLAGQLSVPSPASAQATQPCVVAATHTGTWRGPQMIWEEDRFAVITVVSTSGNASIYRQPGDTRYADAGSGATVVAKKLWTSSGSAGTYTITTTVPCP